MLRTIRGQSLVDPSVSIVRMGLVARFGILKLVTDFRNHGFIGLGYGVASNRSRT